MAKDYSGILIMGVGIGLYLLYEHLKSTCLGSDATFPCSLYNSIFNPTTAPAGATPSVDTSVLTASSQAGLIAQAQAQGLPMSSVQTIFNNLVTAKQNCADTWDPTNGVCTGALQAGAPATTAPASTTTPSGTLGTATNPLTPAELLAMAPAMSGDPSTVIYTTSGQTTIGAAQQAAATGGSGVYPFLANPSASLMTTAEALITKAQGVGPFTFDGWNYYYNQLYGKYLAAAPGLNTTTQPISVEQFLEGAGLSGLSGLGIAANMIPVGLIHRRSFA